MIDILILMLPDLGWNSRFGNALITNYGIFTGMVDVTRTKIPHSAIMQWEYYSFMDGFPALKYEVILSISRPFRILKISQPYK